MLFKRARAAVAITMATVSLGSVSYWSGTSGAATTDPVPRLDVLVHLQDVGDVMYHEDQFAGTRGEARQLEGFSLRINPRIRNLNLRYMAHVANVGDTSLVSEGTFVGTRSQAWAVEGFSIKLVGSAASKYSVKYLAHVENVGDVSCADGEFCGTRGQGLAVEGMQVRIELRGATTTPTTAPAPTTTTTAPPATTTTTVPAPSTPTTTTTVPTPTAPPATGANVTFRPAGVPLSDPEITNPSRGQYEWINQAPLPRWWPNQDSYDRFGWYELEPAQGVYDFSRIDRKLEAAAAKGWRHGVGIMTAMSCCNWGQAEWNGGVQVPDYVKNNSNGSWVHVDGHSSFFPDWNNEFYLARWEALMAALGARYRNDPRFSYLDIRGYGNYGEWWVHNGFPTISGPNALRLVDASVNAFSQGGELRKHLVMLTPRDDALRYALSRSPKVGVRADCLGSDLGPAVGYIADPAHPARSRWQTAPFVTEWCGNPGNQSQFDAAERDVSAYNIASISSGNIDGVGDPPNGAYERATKRSGYRIELDEVSLPATLNAGGAFSVATKWSNVGVTPAYDDWNVTLQLRNPATGAVVVRATSSLNLRSLLPTGSTPRSHADSFVVPSGVAAGTYDVVVQVLDAAGYAKPLNLAIHGKAADGSYKVGSVRVG